MNPPNSLDQFIATKEDSEERLDRILAKKFEKVRSRTYFQKLIDQELVLVNDSPVKKRIRVKEGDEISVYFSLTEEVGLSPEPIPLEILFEDDDLLVVNKPQGLVVHPGAGHWTGTFANALIYHCSTLKVSKGDLRPGIVHRLDKDTTGVLIAAKTEFAQVELASYFAKRVVYKEYLAICLGNPGNKQIFTKIGRDPVHRKKMAVTENFGKEAFTECQTLASKGELSLVKLILHTGRTHQIRVHLSHLGHPILGDPTYGHLGLNKKYNIHQQLLHAKCLKLPHPRDGKTRFFEAPLPEEMRRFFQSF